jgi:hypothetical protein
VPDDTLDDRSFGPSIDDKALTYRNGRIHEAILCHTMTMYPRLTQPRP